MVVGRSTREGEDELDAVWAAEVRRQLLRTVASIADVRDVASGWMARSTELPLVYTLNQVRVTVPASPDEVLALADDHQRELGYRHLLVDDAGTAAVLTEVLAGWKIEHDVFMALSGGPSRPVDPARVVELGEDETAALMRRWIEEEGYGSQPGVVDQLVEYQIREARAWEERRLGVRDESGEAVAATKLRTDGHGTAWVEDVYTVPHARGRGHARALVTEAVRRADAEGHRLTFIIADDDDWPKHLYADVGFRPVAHSTSFHRDLPPARSG